MECKPKMIIAGASAYARTIDFPRFREIADKVRRISDGRYGTYRRSGGSRTSSKPDSTMQTSLPLRHTKHCADREAV